MNPPRNRLRVRFAKMREMRLLGHRDLIRLFERALRRTGLILKLSEGFHPKARLSFPLALATGMEGLEEVMEVEFDDPISPQLLEQLLAAELPEGIELHGVSRPLTSKKARVLRLTYRMPIRDADGFEVEQRIAEFHSQKPRWVIRPGKTTPVDAHAHLVAFLLRDRWIEIVQEATQEACAGPRDLLHAIDMSHLEDQGTWWTRTRVQLEDEIEERDAAGDNIREWHATSSAPCVPDVQSIEQTQ